MANNLLFRNRLNPRKGKRERLAVGAGAAGFATDAFGNLTNFNYDGGSPPDGSVTMTFPVKRAEGAILQVVGAGTIFYTFDGSTPSATVGFSASTGDYIYLDSFQKIVNFSAIQNSAASAIEALAMFGN